MRPKRTSSSIKLPLKSAIAFLILASAPLTGAQTLQTLYAFNSTDGAYPQAALTLGADGNFYGTTWGGGNTNLTWPGGLGTVFKVATNGDLTTLYSFTGGNNGATPPSSLTPGTDGNFYGTTVNAGSGNAGTLFQMATSGALTTLYSFPAGAGVPWAALTLGNDGKFYGTAYTGGSGNRGTVFKVTTSGTLTTLVSFNFTNGACPEGTLTLGSDGNFYGTTAGGGITNSTSGYGMGTVFKVATNGTLTKLYSFTGGNDGATPLSSLSLGYDGNFYGTTEGGGITNSTYPSGMGTVFKVTTNGTLTTLVSFTGNNGANPYAALTLGTDGKF